MQVLHLAGLCLVTAASVCAAGAPPVLRGAAFPLRFPCLVALPVLPPLLLLLLLLLLLVLVVVVVRRAAMRRGLPAAAVQRAASGGGVPIRAATCMWHPRHTASWSPYRYAGSAKWISCKGHFIAVHHSVYLILAYDMTSG